MERQPTTAGLLPALGGGLSLLNWGAVVVPCWSGKFHSALPLVGGRGVAGLAPAGQDEDGWRATGWFTFGRDEPDSAPPEPRAVS